MNVPKIQTEADAIEFLGLHVTSDNELIMRSKATRPIQDLVDLANFVRVTAVGQIEFLRDSNVNLNWLVRNGNNKRILTIGPKITGPAILTDTLALETGFLDPYKLCKIQRICDNLRRFGILCPTWGHADFHSALGRAVGQQQVIEGENLDYVWKHLKLHEQMEIIQDLASLTAKMHTVTTSAQFANDDARWKWYLHRAEVACEWLLQNGQITEDMRQEILSSIKFLLSRTRTRALCTIHGDILFHNVFVRKRGSRWEIVGLIDWETAHGIACPVTDALLGAWWMAGEDGSNQHPEIFARFIKAYNAAMGDKVIPTDAAQLDLTLKLVDLVWYLQVLPFTHLREPQRYEPRFESVNLILGKTKNSKPHLPANFSMALH